MRIAIFSDIHGNLQALEAILYDIKNNNIDKVVCLGDIIAIGPNSKECLDLIIKNNIDMVLGNHELYYLKGVEIDDEMGPGEIKHQLWVKSELNDNHKMFLNSLSLKIDDVIENIKISYQHFLLNENSSDVYPFEDLKIIDDGIEEKVSQLSSDITFIGHEHKPFEISNNKKLIDIGSSGCRKDENTFYTILTITDNNITIEKKNLIYDRIKFEDTIKTIEYPDKDIISKIFFGIN